MLGSGNGILGKPMFSHWYAWTPRGHNVFLEFSNSCRRNTGVHTPSQEEPRIGRGWVGSLV